jgi:capsular exopolysaccharide synthesis family protein
LIVGSGSAVAVDRSNRAFHSPTEVAHDLELPLLACVNDFHDSLDSVDPGASPIDASILAVHQPTSLEAEAIRGLRTALYFGSPDKQVHVVQLTSPLANDGKSVLSANLAVSMAQSGKRVLLIDADLRQQRIAQLLGVSTDGGLSRVIAGDEELPDAVQSTAVSNLFVLPSGPIPPNPAELLASARFAQLIEVTRGQYDFVIIDSPPVLAVNDPLSIAPHVDGLVVVVRLTKNSRPAAERCRDMIRKAGIRTLGVVVNGLPRDPSSADFVYSGYGSIRPPSKRTARHETAKA